jgi:hypothetical protein
MTECGTAPLVKKLGIKPGSRLLPVNAPEDFLAKLVGLPADVVCPPAAKEPVDVGVLFVKEAAALKREFPKVLKRLAPAGGLWIAYPKKASKVATDLSESSVRAFGLDAGLVDNKVCAIDEVWTGFRFVYRKCDRR